MCRLAAWYGAPRPVSHLLLDQPWSLHEQAYRPREMQFGTINVDGTGVAWWDPHDPDAAPLRLVSTSPPWSDPNVRALTPRLASHLQIAAVRSATVGIPFGPGNVAPFVHDGHAFAHNGFIEGFRRGIGRELTRRVDDDLVDAMDAVSDSLLLFMLLLSHRRRHDDLGSAVDACLAEVAEVCEARDVGAALNIVVADGDTLVATRASHQLPLNSLYLHDDADGVTVASEALDPAQDFRPVPSGAAVVVDRDGHRIRALTAPLG